MYILEDLQIGLAHGPSEKDCSCGWPLVACNVMCAAMGVGGAGAGDVFGGKVLTIPVCSTGSRLGCQEYIHRT